MAKALLGHLPADLVGPRLMAEAAVLRRRVADLEAEVARLNEALDRATQATADAALGAGLDLDLDLDGELRALDDVSVRSNAASTV
jgi:hypothetical protein